MKRPSFGIIGLTRDELSQQQLLLDVTRKHPEQGEHLVAWLKAVAMEICRPPSACPVPTISLRSKVTPSCADPFPKWRSNESHEPTKKIGNALAGMISDHDRITRFHPPPVQSETGEPDG